MKLKSRLVAMGNPEKAEMRSDSPTADNEAIHLVFSFAASQKLKVRSGDLENAYFLGMKMSRTLVATSSSWRASWRSRWRASGCACSHLRYT